MSRTRRVLVRDSGLDDSREVSRRSQSSSEKRASSAAINWDSVGDSSPIPREMPANESDDPYEAGFAREWVEHALRNYSSAFGRYSGSPLIDPKPLILDIISEPKNVEDRWPYGIEYELRQIVEREAQKAPAPVMKRVFCSGRGCLLYLEFEGGESANISTIPKEILNAPWRKEYGIAGENLFVLIGGEPNGNVKWQLFMLYRHPE